MSCLSRLDWTQCSLFFMSILTQPGMKQDSLWFGPVPLSRAETCPVSTPGNSDFVPPNVYSYVLTYREHVTLGYTCAFTVFLGKHILGDSAAYEIQIDKV